MHQRITYLLAIITLFLVEGCSEPTQTIDKNHPEVVAEQAVQPLKPDNRMAAEITASAKSLQQDAIALGHAWRTTSDHISEAEQLLASDELKAARNAALRAELSASASIDQAHSEQSAWQDRFPK